MLGARQNVENDPKPTWQLASLAFVYGRRADVERGRSGLPVLTLADEHGVQPPCPLFGSDYDRQAATCWIKVRDCSRRPCPFPAARPHGIN
jgi:hypothetical protein